MKNKYFVKKFFVGLIYVLFLILVAFWMVDGYFDLKRELRLYDADAKDAIDQRLASLFSEINDFPKTVGDDLLFLRRLSSLNSVLNSVGAQSKDEAIKDLEIDFLGFLRESIVYFQLRYIDEKGNEVVKIEFDGTVYGIIPEDALENKKGTDYFDTAIRLNERDIFISPLDLVAEKGRSEYIPVMRYATPVFDYEGLQKGIIISDVYADYFLENIRRSQREREALVLINQEGYYLAHPNRYHEFAFLFGRDDNFYHDYPEISEDTLTSLGERRFETDNLIFSFRYIYPTAGSFEIHKGSEKIFGENPEENYFWVLVSISEKDEINKISRDLKKNYLYTLLFSGIIVLVIIISVFIVAFKISESESFT